MKDTLFSVAIHSPKGKYERTRDMRLMSGRLHVIGEIVTLAPDSLPFRTRQYTVIGKEADGRPIVKVR